MPLANATTRRLIAASALLCAAALAAPAAAQTYSGSITSPSMGTIASGTGAVTFTFDPSTGTVTSSPTGTGGGTISGKTTSTRFAVSYTCTPGSGAAHKCPTAITIKLTSSTGTGFGALSSLSYSASAGTVTSTSTSGSVYTLNITPDATSHDAALYIGGSVALTASSTGTVSTKLAPQFLSGTTTLTTATAGTLSATAIKPLGISSITALNFGTYVRPISSATVVFTPGAAAPTVTGTTRLNQSGRDTTPSTAVVTVTGQDQEAFTVGYDTTVTMTTTGGSIAVTLATNAAANPKLGTKSPADGTTVPGQYKFNVGGYFNLSSSTVIGTYTGTYHVTVTYQ